MSKMIILNVYMPCDNRSSATIDPEYDKCINTIEQFIEGFDGEHVVIAGDFNTDMSRSNAHTRCLADFVQRNNLMFVADNFPEAKSDYTFIRGGMEKGSHIDHIIISKSLCSYVGKYNIDHDPLNPSQHDPVIMQLNIEINDLPILSPLKEEKRIAWHKVSENMYDEFRDKTDNLLTREVNSQEWEVFQCNNMGCDNTHHKNEIDILLSKLCDISLRVGDNTFPKIKPARLHLPRWSEEVSPFKQKALLWHRIWCDSGRPQSGFIFDIRRKTRNDYHKAVKKLKMKESDLRKSRLAERVATGDQAGLWNELKKMKVNKNVSPPVVDNIADPKQIAEMLGNKYKVLYNSVPPDKDFMMELDDTMTSQMKNEDNSMYCFSTHDIEKAIQKIKDGKNDGDVGFVSNYVTHSSGQWRELLAKVISAMFSHSYNPSGILSSTIASIPKDSRGNLCDSNNYRGIALFNCINKIIDWLLLLKYPEQLASHNLQFAYKPFHSTNLCTSVLKDVVSQYVSRGSTVFCCLLDATKAFDRLRHDILFDLLKDRGLPPTIIKFLMDGYSRQDVRASWSGHHSEYFKVANGVRQGGVLSPILFTLYMDELIKRLEAAGDGCYIGHMFMGALGYADDISLLAPTAQALARMLKVCETFGMDYDLQFNSKKTVCISFSKTKPKKETPQVTLNGEVLKWECSVKHLGNYVSNDLDDKLDICHKKNDLTGRANSLRANFKCISSNVVKTLYRSHCCFFYGSQTWDLSSNNINDFEIAWRKAGRSVLQLPYRTRSALMPALLEQKDLKLQLAERFVKMVRSVFRSNNHSIMFLVNNSVSDAPKGKIGQNIDFVNRKYGISILDEQKIPIQQDDDDIMCRAELINEMLEVRDGLSSIDNMNKEELDCSIEWACTY